MSARRLSAMESHAPGRDKMVFDGKWGIHIVAGRFRRRLMLTKSEHVHERTCD